MNDSQWIRKALRLAKKGWGTTSPNPMVGAIVVKNGKEIGQGWHRQAGDVHAEVDAVNAAQDEAKDAVLYVTLEPCSTYGKTPPCIERIKESGIKRVVIGSVDPNPKHNGKGVAALRAQGIEVEVGIEHDKCVLLNEAFFCWVRYRRPYILMKLAMTVDGKIATKTGHSQWISSSISRKKVQSLRQWADAILIGAETVRHDNPSLLVRIPKTWSRQPLRIIACRSGRLDVSSRVLSDNKARTRVVSFESASEWRKFFLELGKSNITSVLVEGGGEIAGNLLHYNLIDKVAIFVAPLLLGGKNSRNAFAGPDPLQLGDAKQLKDLKITRSGVDFLVTGYLTDVHRVH